MKKCFNMLLYFKVGYSVYRNFLYYSYNFSASLKFYQNFKIPIKGFDFHLFSLNWLFSSQVLFLKFQSLNALRKHTQK